MPPIGLLLGKVNFADLFIPLSGTYDSLAQAKAPGAPTINYGMFVNTIIDFVIVAFVIFMIVKQMNRLKKPEAPAAPDDDPAQGDEARPLRFRRGSGLRLVAAEPGSANGAQLPRAAPRVIPAGSWRRSAALDT